MKNTIAEHKDTPLIIQVNYIDDEIIKGKVLVNDYFYPIGYVATWSTKYFNISKNEPKEDKIVTQIVDKFKQRSEIGIKKYNTTLAENNTDDYYEHISEELMDALLYLQKIKEQKDTYFLLLGRYNEMKEQYEKLQAKVKDLC